MPAIRRFSVIDASGSSIMELGATSREVNRSLVGVRKDVPLLSVIEFILYLRCVSILNFQESSQSHDNRS